jgi:hypothetical protein
MESRTRRLATAIVVITVAVAVAGCGVSTQSTPRVIEPSEVPFGLMEATRSPPTSPPRGAAVRLGLYFVGPSGLATVVRELQRAPTPGEAADALMAGPTSAEAHAGYRSAVVPGAIKDVEVNGGVATVELDSEFLQQGRLEQALAIAQIVFTLTGVENVTRVRFFVDDEALPVAQSNGRTTTEPIGRDRVVIPPSS